MLAKRCKIGLTLLLFFTSAALNICCVAHSMCCRVQGEKMNNFIQQRKYIALSELFLNQSVKLLPQISELRIWCSSRKFGHEVNEKDFFISEFLEVFYFLSDFIVAA